MTVTLKRHDLTDTPYPFDPDTMDHVVCTGVLHLFEDIRPIFQELSRIIKPVELFPLS